MREILFRGFHPCDGMDTMEVIGTVFDEVNDNAET